VSDRSLPGKRNRFREGALAALLYASTGLFYLRPIWRVFADHLAPDDADPLFAIYVLRWVGHQARLGFPDLWNANVFYPAKGALAFSDHFLLPSLLLAAVHNTVAGYNVLLFLSFVLVGLAVWWVLRASGVSGPAAIVGGALYAFSPYRLSQLNHLAILFVPCLPLTLWSFDRLLAEPRQFRRAGQVGRAGLFLLFYALNLASGCYLAYMIHFPLLAIFLSRALAQPGESPREARLRTLRSLRLLAPVALLAAAFGLALFLPYIRRSHDMRMARDPGEVVAYSAALASYVSPAAENLYSPHSIEELDEHPRVPRWQQPFVRSENSLFPGFFATLLGALGLVAFWRRYRIRRAPRPESGGGRRLILWTLLGLALAAFVLGDVYTLGFHVETVLSPWLPPVSRALWQGLGLLFVGSLALWAFLSRCLRGGPLLDWRGMDPWERGLLLSGVVSFLLSFPLLYIPLMGIVPGMSGMRVPARFAAFLGLTVVWLAARGLDGLAGRMSRPVVRRLLFAALLLVVFLELLPRPVRWVEVPREEDFPAVYRWLAGRDDVHALIEVPLRPDASEAAYMYYSTLHWKPIVNGFSGFIPPSYERIAEGVARFLPDAEAVSLLASEGVTHIVVHPDLLGGPWRRVKDPAGFVRRWEEEMGTRVELVYAAEPADPDRVYRIVPRPPGG
jgi:hypothetical protein